MQAQPQATPKPGLAVFADQGARATPSPSAIYEGLKAQRTELTQQVEGLQSTRESITDQLQELPSSSSGRTALEARLTDVDKRIASADQMLAANAMQIAQASAVPGAVVEPPPFVQQGVPQEAWVMGGIFLLLVIFPLTVALARRIWRRTGTTITAFPKDLAERLQRMEHSIEATSIEVERIGEGQRFLTRLFTEGEGARAISGGAPQMIERKGTTTPDRLP
jgi:hypothetical protein